MKKLLFLIILYSLNSFYSYTQELDNKEIIGIYFGKMRMEGSISGHDIALRFYENGAVIASIIPKRPTNVNNFARTFDRKSKRRFSTGNYKIVDGKIEFELKIILNGKNYPFSFSGKFSFSKNLQVILYSIKNLGNRKQYRLYSERLWVPNSVKRNDPEKEEPENIEVKEEAVPSKVENIENINQQISELDKNIENENFDAAAGNLNNIGLSHFNNKDYEEAIKNLSDALVMSEMAGNKKATANIHNNLGVSHERLNQKKSALVHFNKAKDHFVELGDNENAAKVLYQISLLERNHLNKEGEKSALEDLIKFEKKNGNAAELSASFNNLAISMVKLKKVDEALEMLEKSKELDEKAKADPLLAITINNIGNIEFENGNVQQAIQSYRTALAIKQKLGNKKSEAITLHNLGNALYSLGELDSAQNYLSQSLLMSKSAKDAKTMNANYRALANLLSESEECSAPLDHYKSYISMRFSVVESETIKPLYEEKSKYLDSEFRTDESLSDDIKKLGIGNDDLISINMLQEDLRQAQKQAELEIAEQENEIRALEMNREILESENEIMEEKSKTLTWIIIGGTVSGLLILSLLILAMRNQKRTKADKLKIQEQKEVIEEKNKGFMDSVTYASRLQTAILPPDNVLAEQLKEFFVLYKPKDIVAGDFYWTETIGKYTYVAAADCTGHGVPGAMVSVVCSNSLFRAVNEFGLRDTGEILDKVRELVIQTFAKSVEEVKDGMDISMVRLEKDSNTIQYTGANNSLIIVRDRKEGQEMSPETVYNDYKYLEEFKADKQPVGQYQVMDKFTTNTIEVCEGDQLFLFSDGYADQFGGLKGKKMKVKTLKDLFLEVSVLDMDQQKERLDKSFKDWMADFEQVDDVCVMGVRV